MSGLFLREAMTLQAHILMRNILKPQKILILLFNNDLVIFFVILMI